MALKILSGVLSLLLAFQLLVLQVHGTPVTRARARQLLAEKRVPQTVER